MYCNYKVISYESFKNINRDPDYSHYCSFSGSVAKSFGETIEKDKKDD
jgi:hypothetical protein